MSRLPLVTAKQMCKIAEKSGFRKIRQKGSHAFYGNEKGESTVIPLHVGDLKRGLIRSIVSDLGLSIEAYERLRKEG